MITKIIFPGKIPGLNSSGGLLRTHWAKRKKMKQLWVWRVKASTTNKHPGKVKMTLTRYSINPTMDYDNLVSTGKQILDAIVIAGVITDDNSSVIVQREYRQEKAKAKVHQRTEILIEDVI